MTNKKNTWWIRWLLSEKTNDFNQQETNLIKKQSWAFQIKSYSFSFSYQGSNYSCDYCCAVCNFNYYLSADQCLSSAVLCLACKKNLSFGINWTSQVNLVEFCCGRSDSCIWRTQASDNSASCWIFLSASTFNSPYA